MDKKVLCVDERHGTPCLADCPVCIDEGCDPKARASVAEARAMFPDWDPAELLAYAPRPALTSARAE